MQYYVWASVVVVTKGPHRDKSRLVILVRAETHEIAAETAAAFGAVEATYRVGPRVDTGDPTKLPWG